MSTCSNCGTRHKSGTKFCPECGEALSGHSTRQVPPAPSRKIDPGYFIGVGIGILLIGGIAAVILLFPNVIASFLGQETIEQPGEQEAVELETTEPGLGGDSVDQQPTPTPEADALSPTIAPIPEIPPEYALLFQDDFSDPNSGWSTGEYPDDVTTQRGSIAYQEEALRIVVADPGWMLESEPGLTVAERVMEFDAIIPGTADENDLIYYGLTCWVDKSMAAGYQFFITSHGYFGVMEIGDGTSQYFGMEGWRFNEAIKAANPEGVSNHLRVDCVGEGFGFYVNDVFLIQIPAGEVTEGAVSLFAGTYPDTQAGADVRFDNFELYGSEAFRAEPAAGTIRTRESDGAALVYVPSGTFLMGSTEAQLGATLELCNQFYGDCKLEWWENEQPAHTVSLDGFWIDQAEVTNAQFQACVNAGECAPPAETHSAMEAEYFGNPAFDNYPVIYITWDQARAYCQWAGARLPTEAEWEYAARGPEGNIFPWGDEFNGLNLNYCDADCPVGTPDESVADGYREVGEVDSYPQGASWVGAYDMAGNVWEYVADWYGAYPSEDVQNPQGPDSGERRVMRGGAWDVTPDSARSANRYGFEVAGWNYAIGFRCAQNHTPEALTPIQAQAGSEPQDDLTTDTSSEDSQISPTNGVEMTEIGRWDTEGMGDYEGQIVSLSFSPREDLLAVGLLRGLVVYRVEPFELLWREDSTETFGHDQTFSHDGSILGSLIYHHVALRDPLTGEILRAFEVEAPGILGFSPDGTKLVADTGRGEMLVLDSATGEILTTIAESGGVTTVEFLADNLTFATGDSAGNVHFWNITAESVTQTFKDDLSIDKIDISPDEQMVATTNGSLWDIGSGELAHELGNPSQDDVAFSPAGKFLAIAGYDGLNIWDPVSGANLVNQRVESELINSVAFSADGKQLAVGTRSGLVIVWAIDD